MAMFARLLHASCYYYCFFQENQRSCLKALTESMGRLEEREDVDRGHLNSVETQILNLTGRALENNVTEVFRKDKVQDSRLAALEEKLEELLEVSKL